MSNLIDRLRKGVQENEAYSGSWNIAEADGLMEEAADVIDRSNNIGFTLPLGKRLSALAINMAGEWPPHVIEDVNAAASLVGGKIKNLEWDKDGEVWRSRTSIGEYVIGMVGIHHGWVNNGLTGWHFSTSVECAKLECQTDYEQRILEALELTKSQEHDGQ